MSAKLPKPSANAKYAWVTLTLSSVEKMKYITIRVANNKTIDNTKCWQGHRTSCLQSRRQRSSLGVSSSKCIIYKPKQFMVALMLIFQNSSVSSRQKSQCVHASRMFRQYQQAKLHIQHAWTSSTEGSYHYPGSVLTSDTGPLRLRLICRWKEFEDSFCVSQVTPSVDTIIPNMRVQDYNP